MSLNRFLYIIVRVSIAKVTMAIITMTPVPAESAIQTSTKNRTKTFHEYMEVVHFSIRKEMNVVMAAGESVDKH